MKYHYLSIPEAKKGNCVIHATTDKVLTAKEVKSLLGPYANSCSMVEDSEMSSFNVIYDEDLKKVREQTKEEKLKNGNYQLDNEYIDTKGKVTKYPEVPKGLIKPEFDNETLSWVESVNEEERLDIIKANYSREINIYMKLKAEEELGLIELNKVEIVDYLNSIKLGSNLTPLDRPSIFSRYEVI